MLDITPTIKRNKPSSIKTSAVLMEFNKYRHAPIHSSRMPSKVPLDIKEVPLQNIILYVLAAITIAFVMLFWEGLIRLWELVNFVGTFEWVNAKLISLGQKIPTTSKREIKDIIYNIEPVTFTQ